MDAQDAQDATEEHIYECALAALLAEDQSKNTPTMARAVALFM